MTIQKLLLVLAGGLIGLVLLAVLADRVLLPWIIHSQAEVLAPELVGLDEAAARERAGELGLRVVVGDRVYDEASPAGIVLAQEPRPADRLRQGRPVRVVLSLGERRVAVPDLRGLSQRQAELVLAREGLRLGRIARSHERTATSGVAAQRPHAGSELRAGEAVDVMLRRGGERPAHLVPPLTGRGLAEVRDQLERAGFELRQVRYRRADDKWPGTVLEQSPPAGSRIPLGGSLELVASTRG